MENKKIICGDIDKLLESLLSREITLEKENLFYDHIKYCFDCNKKVESILQVHDVFKAYYKEKQVKDVPPFNWEMFYKKAKEEPFLQKILSFQWLPRFAVITGVFCLIVLSTMFVLFNTNILEKHYKLSDFKPEEHLQEKFGNVEQKSGKTEKTKKGSEIGEESRLPAVEDVEELKLSENKRDITSKYKMKEATEGMETKRKLGKKFEKEVVAPLFSEPPAQLSKASQVADTVRKISVIVFGNPKSSSVDVIEIIDPSCTNCKNSYNIIKEVSKKFNNISYRWLFYPFRRKDNKFFMISESLLAASEQGKIVEMIENIGIKTMPSVEHLALKQSEFVQRSFQKSSETDVAVKSMNVLIKIAKKIGIPDIKRFSLRLRRRYYKKDVVEHIKVVEALGINNHSILLLKDRVITIYKTEINKLDFEKELKNLSQ